MSSPEPRVAATAAQVEAPLDDIKLAQVLYHDWEAQTYDEKWSISFDERCIDYARDRFSSVAAGEGWPYATSLEVGCGTGFFSLDLLLAGVLVQCVERAFTEMLRVLKPGGRVVICGEPTRDGEYVARRLSRLTWAVTTRLTALFTRLMEYPTPVLVAVQGS